MKPHSSSSSKGEGHMAMRATIPCRWGELWKQQKWEVKMGNGEKENNK